MEKVADQRQDPKDRGWAWVVALGIGVHFFLIVGTLRIFGLLYIEWLDLFGESPVKTSLIGSLFSLFHTLVSPLSGYARDRYSAQTARKVIFISGILLAASICGAGWATSLNQVLVLYGVLGGSLAAVIETPTLSMLGVYFKHKRAFASGLALAGGSLGGLVVSLVVAVTNEAYGIRGTLMIIGGLWLHVLVVAAVFMPLRVQIEPTIEINVEDVELDILYEKQPDLNAGNNIVLQPEEPNTKSRAHSENGSLPHEAMRASKDTTCSCVKSSMLDCFTFLQTPHLFTVMLATFCAGFAYHNQFFILPSLATEIGLSKTEMSRVIAGISVTEFFSRILNGYAADKLRQRKAWIPVVSFGVCLVAGFLLAFLPSKPLFIAYAAFLGFFGGVLMPLFLPIAMELVSKDEMGSASGLHPLLNGASIAIGTPIIGALTEATSSLRSGFLLCVSMFAVAMFFMLLHIRGKATAERFKKLNADRHNAEVEI